MIFPSGAPICKCAPPGLCGSNLVSAWIAHKSRCPTSYPVRSQQEQVSCLETQGIQLNTLGHFSFVPTFFPFPLRLGNDSGPRFVRRQAIIGALTSVLHNRSYNLQQPTRLLAEPSTTLTLQTVTRNLLLKTIECSVGLSCLALALTVIIDDMRHLAP
jgi:hypothetical protein